MNAKTLPASVIGLVGLLLFAVGPLGAQDGPFTEVIDVRVVNLEAVVIDKQGIRVQGLGPSDFQLTVDGKEVSLTPAQGLTTEPTTLSMRSDTGAKLLGIQIASAESA